MKQACRKEEIALADLIQARENLRTLLANPKSSGETEQLDYQVQKNMPEKPKHGEIWGDGSYVCGTARTSPLPSTQAVSRRREP